MLLFTIAMLFFVTRCDTYCEATREVKKAQEQKAIFDAKTSEAGMLQYQVDKLLHEAAIAKMTQWEHESKATRTYSGISLNVPVWVVYAWLYEPTENEKILQWFYLDDCRVTNKNHEVAGLQLYWVDIACTRWVHFDVRAPMYYDEYEVVSKWYDNNLGNYIVISANEVNYLFWHTYTQLNVGDKAGKWAIIGNTDMSWASTAPHVHIEVWENWNNTDLDGNVNPDSQAVLDKRKAYQDHSQIYYFTHYDVGDIWQNDASPCIGASGRDLCEMLRNGENFVAVTKDIRLKMWLKFWDKVKLVWDVWCAWYYTVEDEMNCRFRWENAHDNGTCYNRDWSLASGNIKRPWTDYYIKWDLPTAWWACRIVKL